MSKYTQLTTPILFEDLRTVAGLRHSSPGFAHGGEDPRFLSGRHTRWRSDGAQLRDRLSTAIDHDSLHRASSADFTREVRPSQPAFRALGLAAACESVWGDSGARVPGAPESRPRTTTPFVGSVTCPEGVHRTYYWSRQVFPPNYSQATVRSFTITRRV